MSATAIRTVASSASDLPGFRAGLSPAAVDRALRAAVAAQLRAERSVALWFTEVVRRRLHKPLGYGTPFLYATEGLGFSASRAYQLLRVAEAMREHAVLRRAVEMGDVPWTKAREILPVVTKVSARRWVERAKRLSRAELVAAVTSARAGDRSARREDPAQAPLDAGTGTGTGTTKPSTLPGGIASPAAGPANLVVRSAAGGTSCTDEKPAAPARPGSPTSPEHDHSAHTERVPHTVSLRLDPLALARFEGLLAALERAGVRGTREELILDGLEALLAASECARDEDRERRRGARSSRGETGECPRDTASSVVGDRATASGDTPNATRRAFTPHRHVRSPYQVTLRLCPSCHAGHVATSRGDLPVTHEELLTKLIDADYIAPDLRRRASIPPRIRRAVLERDNHTCRAPGCTRRHGLDVHHGDCVAAGGPNELANYITYCDRCHPAMHAKANRERERRGRQSSSG